MATIHVNAGEVSTGKTLNGDIMIVYENGTAEKTNVGADGELHVSNGGIAIGTTVNSDGEVEISSGGKLTGKMTFETGAQVTASSGAILDFDLTQTAAGETALVNDLSIIQGTPVFTLTVDGTETEGVYTLAAGAAGFTGTITVQNTYGADLGTLELGEKVYIGKDDYTLTLTDDVLTVAINAPTVTEANGDVRLENTMPKARYMYGCCPTSVAMLLGYYDLYGYRGNDFSALIEGDVELDARGSGNIKYKMDDFDSNLGKATATRDYLYRFYSHESVDSIVAHPLGVTPTSPEDELPYTFANDGAGPELRTDLWDCLADYLGAGQFWRMNVNLESTSIPSSLEMSLLSKEPETIIDEATQIERTIMMHDADFQCGVYYYVQDKGYSLDMKVTECHRIDAVGGDFTFEDYRKEIDAGRPALVLIDGHIMIGYGYNAETREIIFDDCYEADQRMVWDGTYNYAGVDRKVHSIATVGVMLADCDIDLAVSPFDEESGITDKLIVTTAEGQLESVDYCFVGSPLYLGLAVSNQGTTASGVFDVTIYCDGEEGKNIPSLSLDGETIERLRDIPIAAELGVGLHSIIVRIDPDNEIQETSALNNSDERSVMVLKEGTNVVQGTRTVASGEVSSDDYVMNGARIQVQEGGTAERTLIQGKITEESDDGHTTFVPGSVNVSGGGLIRSATVYEYGKLQLSGTAEDLDIREHGNAVVSSGGIVSGASVEKTGILKVESGGRLTGRIDLESGASVGFEEGGILNFDLTGTNAAAEALVNDLSVIQGTPLYSLTVDGKQSGTYSLADNAAGFDKTITVVNTSGTEFGTLTVGETVRIGYDNFILNLNGDALTVTIGVPDLTPKNLVGTPDGVSWESSAPTAQYDVEFSRDNFAHVFLMSTNGRAIDTPELPAGTWQWRVRPNDEDLISSYDWTVGNEIVSETDASAPKVVRSNEDGNCEIFFASPNGTWSSLYYAMHVSSPDDEWMGTNELVSASGKGRIQNLYFGSDDMNVLCLTDKENGDAIFLDDVYTERPEEIEEDMARLSRIETILAGGGDDIVDMTSRQFAYVGDGMIIRGGDGDDVIWAGEGGNQLFGDAGNDRIVGSSGRDLIVGGSGNDRMHGGGGDDIFTFCDNWGNDEVEQLDGGSVTLWFASGDESGWNASELTYTDGVNSVTVRGVASVMLRFGNEVEDDSYAELCDAKAFDAFSSRTVFDTETEDGIPGFLA